MVVGSVGYIYCMCGCGGYMVVVHNCTVLVKMDKRWVGGLGSVEWDVLMYCE
jgi:hypothetical protein